MTPVKLSTTGECCVCQRPTDEAMLHARALHYFHHQHIDELTFVQRDELLRTPPVVEKSLAA